MIWTPSVELSLLRSFRKHLQNILNRRGPFTDPDWEPGMTTLETLASMKIL